MSTSQAAVQEGRGCSTPASPSEPQSQAADAQCTLLDGNSSAAAPPSPAQDSSPWPALPAPAPAPSSALWPSLPKAEPAPASAPWPSLPKSAPPSDAPPARSTRKRANKKQQPAAATAAAQPAPVAATPKQSPPPKNAWAKPLAPALQQRTGVQQDAAEASSTHAPPPQQAATGQNPWCKPLAPRLQEQKHKPQDVVASACLRDVPDTEAPNRSDAPPAAPPAHPSAPALPPAPAEDRDWVPAAVAYVTACAHALCGACEAQEEVWEQMRFHFSNEFTYAVDASDWAPGYLYSEATREGFAAQSWFVHCYMLKRTRIALACLEALAPALVPHLRAQRRVVAVFLGAGPGSDPIAFLELLRRHRVTAPVELHCSDLDGWAPLWDRVLPLLRRWYPAATVLFRAQDACSPSVVEAVPVATGLVVCSYLIPELVPFRGRFTPVFDRLVRRLPEGCRLLLVDPHKAWIHSYKTALFVRNRRWLRAESCDTVYEPHRYHVDLWVRESATVATDVTDAVNGATDVPDVVNGATDVTDPADGATDVTDSVNGATDGTAVAAPGPQAEAVNVGRRWIYALREHKKAGHYAWGTGPRSWGNRGLLKRSLVIEALWEELGAAGLAPPLTKADAAALAADTPLDSLTASHKALAEAVYPRLPAGSREALEARWYPGRAFGNMYGLTLWVYAVLLGTEVAAPDTDSDTGTDAEGDVESDPEWDADAYDDAQDWDLHMHKYEDGW